MTRVCNVNIGAAQPYGANLPRAAHFRSSGTASGGEYSSAAGAYWWICSCRGGCSTSLVYAEENSGMAKAVLVSHNKCSTSEIIVYSLGEWKAEVLMASKGAFDGVKLFPGQFGFLRRFSFAGICIETLYLCNRRWLLHRLFLQIRSKIITKVERSMDLIRILVNLKSSRLPLESAFKVYYIGNRQLPGRVARLRFSVFDESFSDVCSVLIVKEFSFSVLPQSIIYKYKYRIRRASHRFHIDNLNIKKI